MHEAGSRDDGRRRAAAGRCRGSWPRSSRWPRSCSSASGLLFRAYDRVQPRRSRLPTDHVLTFIGRAAGSELRKRDDERRKKSTRSGIGLTTRLRALPGVEAVGLVSCPPLGCHWGNFFVPRGAPPLKPGETNPVVLQRPASPGLFQGDGHPLLKGRAVLRAAGRPSQDAGRRRRQRNVRADVLARRGTTRSANAFKNTGDQGAVDDRRRRRRRRQALRARAADAAGHLLPGDAPAGSTR